VTHLLYVSRAGHQLTRPPPHGDLTSRTPSVRACGGPS